SSHSRRMMEVLPHPAGPYIRMPRLCRSPVCWNSSSRFQKVSIWLRMNSMGMPGRRSRVSEGNFTLDRNQPPLSLSIVDSCGDGVLGVADGAVQAVALGPVEV